MAEHLTIVSFCTSAAIAHYYRRTRDVDDVRHGARSSQSSHSRVRPRSVPRLRRWDLLPRQLDLSHLPRLARVRFEGPEEVDANWYVLATSSFPIRPFSRLSNAHEVDKEMR